MEKIALMLNPQARSERAKILRRWLKDHSGYFQVYEPSSPEDMFRVLREATESGVKMVAVAGGDGTLSIAAKALVGTDTILGVIPSGTMNVFARELGIGSGNYDRALMAILGGSVKEVDLFMVNHEPFVQMAGVGLDARAVELTTWSLKKKWGALAYVFSAIKAIFEKQPHLLVTTDEGAVYEGRAMIMGNGSRYGGSLRVFRDADNSDGFLDVVLFKKGIFHIIKDCMIALVNGGFDCDMSDDLFYLKVKSCLVRTEAQVPYEMDGDFKGYTPIDVHLSPLPLKVFVP
ncbi:MAG: diacylglycerol kinase family lipid kinase [Akkermansia sp.]